MGPQPRAAGAHLQGLEQLFDRGHDLLLPGAAADHRQALRDSLLRALAGILLAACELSALLQSHAVMFNTQVSHAIATWPLYGIVVQPKQQCIACLLDCLDNST